MSQNEEIIATAGGSGIDFPPHPEGQYAAKCIDVIDRGLIEKTWNGQTKKQHKITLRFYCGETFEYEGEDGLRDMPLWLDAWFTLSLHEKSSLRPFLQGWRGKAFTQEEENGFNVAQLVGVDALIQVTHNVKPQRTYANISSIMKLPKGQEAPTAPDGYVRVKDRPDDERENAGKPWQDDDDDLPF